MKLTEKQVKELLSERKKVNEIVYLLKIRYGIDISPRAWRYFVNKYNKEHLEKNRKITSNNQGYLLTTNKKLISKTLRKNFNVGLSMIRNAKQGFNELSQREQLSFMADEPDVYDLMMELKI